jgi:hypothetical protein
VTDVAHAHYRITFDERGAVGLERRYVVRGNPFAYGGVVLVSPAIPATSMAAIGRVVRDLANAVLPTKGQE